MSEDYRRRYQRRAERIRYLLTSLPGLPLVELRHRIEEQASDSRALADEVRSPVSCPLRAGCWGCCRGEVLTFPEEVDQISGAMDDAAWLRVHDAASSIEADPTHTLCPLLDPETRSCSVYDERPLACRAYLAVTPVDNCYPERTGPRKVGTIMEPQALVGLAVAYREPVYLAAELLRRASARSC